jgi:hypothetical protein
MSGPARRRGSGVQRAVQWLLILIGVAILVVLIRSRPGTRPETAVAPPLARGEGASTVAVTFTRPSERWVLELAHDRWWIREPIRDLASERMVREMLRGLEELEVRRRIETDSLGRYGLKPPALTLALRRADGTTRVFRLGGTAPASGDAYAAWDTLHGVAIIPHFVVARFFEPGLFAWREKELLAPMAHTIDSVWVAAGGELLRLRRIGTEKWAFLVPRDREADAIACERTVAGFSRFQFGGFIDDPALWSGLGLDPPRAVWTVFRGGRADTVAVGDRIDPQTMILRVAGRPPGRAPAELYDFLTGGLAILEERRLVRGNAASLAYLLLAGPGGTRLYARAAAGWRVAEIAPAALERIESGALADTTGLVWRDPGDATLTGDAADLFELRGEGWLAPATRPPARGDYPLRIHLWGRDRAHEWAFFAPEAAGATRARAVGSRFPLRPMKVRWDGLPRWVRRSPGADHRD